MGCEGILDNTRGIPPGEMGVPLYLTGYGVGVTPLAVTQEDFLVLHSTLYSGHYSRLSLHSRMYGKVFAECIVSNYVYGILM